MKKWIILLFFFLVITVIYLMRGDFMNKKTVLKIGFPAYWGNLIPSLQHTAAADVLMVNQFEPLVTAGSGGVTIPVAAKSWTVSDDSRIFTFKIDTDKKFSNGQKLTAMDFKKSWEYGLSLDPKSTNSSLLDVMYRVVGFENFKLTGKLDGVQVLSDETLKIEFKEPFRMALNYLAGSRMAAFIIEGDKYFGTGPYIIKRVDHTVHLLKNPFSSEEIGFDEIEIVVVAPLEANAALKNGLVDMYAFAEYADIKDCYEESTEIGCYSGSEARHQGVMLNGLSGRFFENKKYRQAFQALVHKIISKGKDVLPSHHKFNLNVDPQIYLHMQVGRIDQKEADNIIKEGSNYISDLIHATQKNPIYLVTSEGTNWLQHLLEKEGIVFNEKSGIVPTEDRVKMYYKTYEPDLMIMTLSVASGDPDGIYHALGKNGSISSPTQYRKSVSDLLEQGRKILDLKNADENYKLVSKEFLTEVPFVHLGFSKTMVAYRKDRVQVKSKYKNRDDGKFSIFESI